MGKYLPVIVTADCGSLTRAGEVLGYAQPNMGHIVTRCEEELGVKIFTRNQRGMTLTETGEKLVKIMRQIDEMEYYLQETAKRLRKSLFRVGVFQSVATQWMPQIVDEFCREHPDTVLQMEYLGRYLDDELGVRESWLDCTFFSGTNIPSGMQCFPLLQDPYYLLVHADSPLAAQTAISLEEVSGQYPYIHTNEDFDWDESYKEIRKKFIESDLVKIYSPENNTAIALVAQGVGVSIVPELSLCHLSPELPVRAIPLREPVSRSISLLCPKELKNTALTATFLRLLQKRVEEWKREHAGA